MKKTCIMAILLMGVMATTACVYASEANIGDYTFTVPKGFEVIDSGDVVHMNKTDDTQSLTVMASEKDITSSESVNNMIQGLEDQGYDVSNNTFKYKGRQITQIDYKNSLGRGHMYLWKTDDICIGIVYGHIVAAGNGKWDVSPAKEVFDTLKKA